MRKAKKDRLSLREALAYTLRGFAIWWKVDPKMFAAYAAKPAVTALAPYVPLYFTARLVNAIAGGGEAEQTGDLHGGGVLRVDDRVDFQVPPQLGHAVGVLLVADAGDGVLGAQTLGGETADHVDLVRAGGGHQKVRLPGTGLPQGGGGHPVAPHRHDVQGVPGPAQGVVVQVHHRYVVLLPHQLFRQGEAHFSTAYNDNIHN